MVAALGNDYSGQTNVPTGMSNVLPIAAGDAHSPALINDGTLVSWSDDTYGQTNTITEGSRFVVKLILVVSVLASQQVNAESFQNLNFKQANPVIDPRGQFYPNDVYAASALPYWTVDLGAVPPTDVLENASTDGQASVDIFSPNYPAAGPAAGGLGSIDGNYSVALQSGNLPGSATQVGASIAQYGTIPSTAQSLEFETYALPPFGNFSISFEGNNLSPVVLANEGNYTLLGVNLAPYEGQTGTLEFSTVPIGGGQSYLELEGTTFSPNAVPEPSIVALGAMGGLLFGARKWLARRC